jgi:hypothetical protein
LWDVSKTALQSGNVTGLANLTYLTTALQFSGIFLVGLLPRYKKDLQKLQMSGHSQIGGFLFLFVTFASVGWSVFVSLMNIIRPGWMGES